MPQEGNISFQGYNAPHPADLDHSAEEYVHIAHPGLAETDPDQFASEVVLARQWLEFLEGNVAEYDQT